MTALVLFVLPAIAMIWVSGSRLEVGLLASLGLGQWLAGSWLTQSIHPRLFDVCLLGTVALVLGYAVARSRHVAVGDAEATPSTYEFRAALPALSILTIVLVAYHFWKVGIPILSSNVETSRFELANSGLFGLPSRAYLFGLPILVLSYAGIRDRTQSERRMVVVVASVFVVSRMAGGLKSGLLEVLFVTLIAQIIHSRGESKLASRPVLRRALLGVVAVVFAGYVSTLYATVHAKSVSGVAHYLETRVTTGTVSAGAYAVDVHGRVEGGPFLLRDFSFYANKYANGKPAQWGFLDPPQYSTSRLISAGVIGVPASTNGYVSPVAVGLAPSFFLDWGWTGVVVGMFGAGFVMRRIQWRAVRSSGLQAGIWGAATLVSMYIVTNGGPAYYTINLCATAAFYFLLAAALSLRHRDVPSGVSSFAHVSR